MQKTPLNQIHRDLGARMVDFGGWDMPVQYAGVIEEHLAVRQSAGLFDVSHMGEIQVTGANALAYIQWLTVNDAAKLVDGQVQYSAFCYPEGGVVDDVTLYRFSDTRFMFCVNAANIDKDFAWMQQVLADSSIPEVTLVNRSKEFAQIALQGPKAEKILACLTDLPLANLAYYHFCEGEVDAVQMIVSRTGYTGEDGFEL
ncbi:MAG: glycine cleavage system aminomethyltransferase GcvT, partial [Desulfuromonadales bacterium]|nr:glycine cleavage system aminomethyltransferase GcvT [Desulfuromonadales bacterium]